MLNWQSVWRRIICSACLLALLLTSTYPAVNPVQAAPLRDEPVEGNIIVTILSQPPSKVCFGQKVNIEFGVMIFSSSGGQQFDPPLAPLVPLADITMLAKARSGKVTPGKFFERHPAYWKAYTYTLTYTAPRKAGKDMVSIAAFFVRDEHRRDLEFDVKRCKYAAAIQATEKDVAFPADAAALWKPVMSFNAIGEFEQAEESNSLTGNGTVNMWLDAIYQGPREAFSCDVTQMLSGSGTFEVEGVQEDTLSLDAQFSSMAFGPFTVACQGAGGSGSGGIPASTGPAFAINFTMPDGGGTQDYNFSQGTGNMILHITVFPRS
ncbi:hypothetical protein TFLX_00695 [Thermoflexales bacterium]|nr:hypothetical protein TFLX_00695 [Thermoflexales bacterium]